MIPAVEARELGRRSEKMTQAIDKLQDVIVRLNKPIDDGSEATEFRFESGSSTVHYRIKGTAQAQKRFAAFAEQELAYMTGELIGTLAEMQRLISPVETTSYLKPVNFAHERTVITQEMLDDMPMTVPAYGGIVREVAESEEAARTIEGLIRSGEVVLGTFDQGDAGHVRLDQDFSDSITIGE